jgi:hypothetical protein
MYRQRLEIWQQFCAVPRTMRLVGEDGLPETVSFMGADLEGVDVYLEPAPGVDQTKTSVAQAAETDAVAGFTNDMAQTNTIRASGQDETPMQDLTRRIVQQQAQQALQGYAVQAEPGLDLGTAVAVVDQALAVAQGTPEQLAPLQALLQAYQQLAAPQTPPDQQPQSQAAPKFAPNVPKEPLV